MTLSAEQWQQRLAAMNDHWNEAEAAEGGSMFVDPPDDDYQGTVYAFDFIDTDRDGRPFAKGALLKIQVQVAHGPHAGKVTGELYALEDPDRLPFTKGVLATLGVDVDKTPLHAIYPGSDVLEALLDVPVEFTVKRSKRVNESTGQPYVNVYINKRLGGPMRAEGGGQGSRTGGQAQQHAQRVEQELAQQLPVSQEHQTDVPADTQNFAPPPPGNCICTGGQVNEKCEVHGIPF